MALIATLLTGCGVPHKFSGYLPSGPGTVEGVYCSPPGIKDVLFVPAEAGVRIMLRARDYVAWREETTIALDVSLFVPEGVTVQVLSPRLIFRSPEWAQPRVLPVIEITSPGPRFFPPTAPVHGTTGPMGRFDFWFLKDQPASKTGLPKVSSFTLQFPPLRINDKIYRMGTVKFVSYTKWSIYTCI